MIIFSSQYYSLSAGQHVDVTNYSEDLGKALINIDGSSKVDFLIDELKEITKHITDGIRDIIKSNKNIRELVLNRGALPLATWAEMLDSLPDRSVERLKYILDDMRYQLEHGKIQGFPATMYLEKKPSFVTFEPFYNHIFAVLGEIERNNK